MKVIPFLFLAFFIVPLKAEILVVESDDNSISLLKEPNLSVEKRIFAGQNPFKIAVSKTDNKAYVTNFESHTITAIDLATGKVSDTFPAGDHPEDIVLTPDNRFLYVTNKFKSQIKCIDLATTKIVATISVERDPTSLTMDPQGKFLYVLSRAGNTLTAISIKDNQIFKTISVGRENNIPSSLALTPDGKTLYVANEIDSTLLVLETDTLETKSIFSVDFHPTTVSVSDDGQEVFVVCNQYELNGSSNTLYVIDRSEKTKVADLKRSENRKGHSIKTLKLDNKKNIEGHKLIQKIDIGEARGKILENSKTRTLYLLNKGDNAINVIDLKLGKMTSTIPVGRAPTDLGHY
jgi:YVTN family beta-propeller protein